MSKHQNKSAVLLSLFTIVFTAPTTSIAADANLIKFREVNSIEVHAFDELELFLVKHHGVSSAELHALDGATNHKTFSFQGQMALANSGPIEFEFDVGDFYQDSPLDVYVIKALGNNVTEIHILDGATDYSSYLLQTKLPLPRTNFVQKDFEIGTHYEGGLDDLYVIKMQSASSTT